MYDYEDLLRKYDQNQKQVSQIKHFLAHLAKMPKSLCNHELFVVCHRDGETYWVVVCVQSSWAHIPSQKSHILYKYAHTHEPNKGMPKLGHRDLYFSHDIQFSFIGSLALKANEPI